MVRLYEPTSTECSQWATSLLYSLCIIFWMITMCCEVSYLYIKLLAQLSYLTYVGFLNRDEKKDISIYIVAWRVMLMHACMDANQWSLWLDGHQCNILWGDGSVSVGRQEIAELLRIDEVNISGINERVSKAKDRCVALSNHAPNGC